MLLDTLQLLTVLIKHIFFFHFSRKKKTIKLSQLHCNKFDMTEIEKKICLSEYEILNFLKEIILN